MVNQTKTKPSKSDIKTVASDAKTPTSNIEKEKDKKKSKEKSSKNKENKKDSKKQDKDIKKEKAKDKPKIQDKKATILESFKAENDNLAAIVEETQEEENQKQEQPYLESLLPQYQINQGQQDPENQYQQQTPGQENYAQPGEQQSADAYQTHGAKDQGYNPANVNEYKSKSEEEKKKNDPFRQKDFWEELTGQYK